MTIAALERPPMKTVAALLVALTITAGCQSLPPASTDAAAAALAVGELTAVDLRPYIDGDYASPFRFRPPDSLAKVDGQVEIAGVSFQVAANDAGEWLAVDVGKSEWKTMTKDEGGSFNPAWCHVSAKKGDLVLHLPTGFYHRAYVLAMADDGPDRDPVLTLRTGAFQGRGFLANSSTVVPTAAAADTPGIRASVTGVLAGKNATRAGRLYVIPIDIPTGDLLKLVQPTHPKRQGPALKGIDVQLTRRLHVKVSAPDPFNFSLMPLGAPSAVHVFGIAFERTPVTFDLVPRSPFSVFPDAAQPELDLIVTNHGAETRNVAIAAEWRPDTPTPGRTPSQSKSWSLKLEAGEKQTLAHAPASPDFGVYQYDIALRDDQLGPLLAHRTTYARLPKLAAAPMADGRRSRFCTWWWNGTHFTTGGDLGVDLADWLGLGYAHFFAKTKQTLERLNKHGIRGYFEDARLCFHEFNISGPQMMRYPSFMLKEPRYKLNEKEEARFQSYWKSAVAQCTKLRKESPDTEIIFGNSSYQAIDEYLYRGFPAKFFDSLGHEACGLMRMPERQPELAALQEVYWFRRALEEYGYDKPLTACSEWQYHSTNPGNHTWQEQADLYVRDILHALTYGFDRIAPSCMEDVGGAYYWANWGASGLVTRSPDVHPKTSYVAYAVAAHLLSDADFVRAVPTGSHSVYLLEFKRRRGDRLFAGWTLRGRRPLTVVAKGAAAPRLLGQQGNAAPLARQGDRLAFALSGSPVFLTGVDEVSGIVLGAPDYGPLPTSPKKLLDPLQTMAGWALRQDANPDMDDGNFDMPRQKGEFRVTPASDPVRGDCLEFALLKSGRRPPYIPSYQAIEAATPIELPGRPTEIGLWVRGNSGWGRIDLELRDAEGERWLAIGMPNAWNANDEQSVSYIIFDDWRWMQIPLPGHYGSGFHWPRFANWRHDGGNGKVDYPLKLTAVIVEQRKQVVYVNDMVDASSAPVRLQGLHAVYGNPENTGDWATYGRQRDTPPDLPPAPETRTDRSD